MMSEIKKLSILFKAMVNNYHAYGAVWKNIELGKQAFAIMKSLPPILEGEFDTPADKALLLSQMDETSTPRFCIEVREYIKELNHDDEDNIKELAMLNDYIDPDLSMEEYCAKYKKYLKFDPVERSRKWEEVIFCVEKECDEILKNESRGMGFCFMYWSTMEKVLAKYGINWKSPTIMNPGVLFDRHIKYRRYMWKSKYRCFIIESRYVCTKDNNLAEGYSSLKSVVQYKEFADEFGRQLKKVIDSLEAFAYNRKLLDKKLYAEIRKTLTLCYDTCTLSDADFDNARYMLIDTIYKLQELEELADKASPLTFSKDEGYDPKASYKELGIKATHVTRDMSVGNTYSVGYYTDIDQFGGNEETCINLPRLDGGRVKLVSVTEDAVTLKWGEEEFHVNFGSEVSTKEYLINNPLPSSDLLKLTFSYRKSPNYAELWSMIAKVGCDELEGKEERRALTARKKYILHHIKKAIEQGNTGLYVAKALLTEYNNWGTCKINNLNFFRQQLLEGIERGSLAPDNYFGWEWMEVATKYNAPTDFMEDMELYYEVLDTAACHGVVEAIDIMDSIWEPEQIIEED